MPMVTKKFTNITVPNDPSTSVLNTHVDLSLLLSEYYGKSIRQGHNFCLKGVQATLVPSSGATDDFDVGMSAIVKHSFIPTTKHSRKAWNMVFNQWKKQQKLTTRGTHMRYNDFELGWDSSASYHNSSRISTLHSTGLGDDTSEIIVLTGNSTAATDFSLQDMYNSQVRPLHQGVDHFGLVTPKGPKYDYSTRYPEVQEFLISASTSTMVDSNPSPDIYGGSLVLNNIQEFPMSLDIMCGFMKLNVYVPQDDTIGQWADTCDLFVTYYVSKFTPLVYKSKKNRRKSSRKYVRKYRGRRGRRYKSRR